MSQQNVDLVRSLYAAWNRRDIDEWLSFLAPDIVFRPVPTFTDSQERRGLDAMRRWMVEWFEVWADDHSTQPESIRGYGDAVIALLRFTGQARASGVEVAGGIFEVFRFRDGKIASVEDFTDRTEALNAAGLEE
ncbi:MAG TPA: nuclear transport factor 2 family protein [Anaeromyxobacteraceae bacterium]|nr:nuclear transport factor 2 family protein [Anaeromyxobacteraceae bacterium]